jgi:flagellar basal body-associated protein FliL
MPSPDPNVKRRNWIVLIVLVVVAVAVYVSFMVKMMANHG